jgi:mxaJ protein
MAECRQRAIRRVGLAAGIVLYLCVFPPAGAQLPLPVNEPLALGEAGVCPDTNPVPVSALWAGRFERDHGGPPAARGALRVCADPGNMPFSDRRDGGMGLENRLAELLAGDLGIPLEYTWHPQRAGYLRQTLRYWLENERRYRCDVVMGVPRGARGFSTTSPYFHSTHVLVYAKGRGLDGVGQVSDLLAMTQAEREGIRIGVFDRSPAAAWLVRHGMRGNMVAYMQSDADPAFYPGRIIEQDLVEGRIDAVIIWGPIGGYYANRAGEDLAVLPMQSERHIPFDFAVAIGVREGDEALLQPLQTALDRHRDTIDRWLVDYHIPVVDSSSVARR